MNHSFVLPLFPYQVLRALAEGKIKWAFWPPGADEREISENGIWISGNAEAEDASDTEDEEEAEAISGDEELESDDSGQSSEDEKDTANSATLIGGRFDALVLEESREGLLSEDEDSRGSEDGGSTR
jgi:hypothetical protein